MWSDRLCRAWKVTVEVSVSLASSARGEFVVVLNTDGGTVVSVLNFRASAFDAVMVQNVLDVTLHGRHGIHFGCQLGSRHSFLGQRGARERCDCDSRCEERFFHVAPSFLS